MKFVGLFKGEFKILENLDVAGLRELNPDFMWLDADKVDIATEKALQELYGISSISEFGFPSITTNSIYDLVRVNYFKVGSKQEIQIFISKKFVITVHTGQDEVCDESMASVNEMLVSGAMDSGSILRGIFSTVVEKHAEHLQAVQNSQHELNQRLKQGISNVSYLTQLNNNSHETRKVFYDTRSQLADIVLKAVNLKGVSNPEAFADLYSKMNELTKGADYFTGVVSQYINTLIPYMWNQLSAVKKISTGLALMSLFFALSALYPIFLPYGIPGIGIENFYIVLTIMALGVMAFFASQKKMTFKI